MENKVENSRFEHRANCPVCCCTTSKVLYSEDAGSGATWEFLQSYYSGRIEQDVVTGVPYEVVQCADCDFVWQSYVLSEVWLTELYEQWIAPDESLAKEKAKSAAVHSSRANQLSLIGSLLRSCSPQDIRVLDFGMGWGFWAVMAKAFGFQICGHDLSPSRQQFAKANGITVIDDLSNYSEYFDYINIEQVLEHVVDPAALLKVLAKLLRFRGVTRIGVPDGRMFLRKWQRGKWVPSKDQVHPLEHVNCFTHRTLTHLADSCGLRPISLVRLIGIQLRQCLTGCTSFTCVASSLYTHACGTAVVFEKEANSKPLSD